jgi:methyl-accepting chemotaxis protein
MTDDGRSIARTLAPQFLRRSYRAKFVVSIMLVIFLIGAVGIGGYAMTKGTVETNTQEQLEETSALQADALSEWIESMRIQTRSLSADDRLQTIDGDEERHLQGEQSRLATDIMGIHLVNTSAETVTASTDPIAGFSLDTLAVPWANVSVSGATSEQADEVWISDSAYESPLQPHDEKYVTAFASPVPRTDDRYVVVVTRVGPQLESIKRSATGSVTKVVNERGERVLLPATEARDRITGETVRAVRESGESTFVQRGGVAYAYAAVAGTDWVAVTAIDAEEAFAVRDSVSRQVMAIVLTGVLSLALVGAVLASQTIDPLIDLRNRAAEMESGNLEVSFDSNRIDEIGQLYDGFESMRTALGERIGEVRTARKTAEREHERARKMNEHLEEKADEYSTVMQTCASGDLTARMDPESHSEAMREIAEEFNAMMARFDEIVENHREFADGVAAASEEVTASSEEVRSASEQVTESVQEISDGADQQNERFRAVSAEMDDLSTRIQRIAGASEDVADLASRTAATGETGREAAGDALDGMASVETRAAEAVDAIEALQAETEQIDELSEFIAEIANQTNMLALNANIEASRNTAGVEDEGFSVVAGEVKELAGETKEAAEEIDERLERVRERTDEAVREVQSTSDEIATHAETVERAASSLDEIADYAERTNEGIQKISEAARAGSASTGEVVAMVEEAATISDETSAEAQTVAAAAEEQTSSLTQVTESATRLSHRANQLHQALDRFETSGFESADGDPSPDATRVEGGPATSDERSPEDESTESSDRGFNFGSNAK